jgi:ABC-2 type transport system permease protein
MQQQIHRSKTGGTVNQLGAMNKGVAQVITLGRGELLSILGREVVCWSGSARWFPGLVFDAVASGGTTITTYQRALFLALGYSAIALTAAAVSFLRRDVRI